MGVHVVGRHPSDRGGLSRQHAGTQSCLAWQLLAVHGELATCVQYTDIAVSIVKFAGPVGVL